MMLKLLAYRNMKQLCYKSIFGLRVLVARLLGSHGEQKRLCNDRGRTGDYRSADLAVQACNQVS